VQPRQVAMVVGIGVQDAVRKTVSEI
jgi:hypothetical protein